MATYALQTTTMLESVSISPMQLLGLADQRNGSRQQPKQQLPSKRKRDAICGLGSSNKPFTIKPYPDSPYDRPMTVHPVRIIGRSQLPLVFLDTCSDDNFTSGRLFFARIDILESERGDTCPRVLIARLDTKRTLYAVERVRPQIYSICKLANSLKEKDVTELWDPANLGASILAPKPDVNATATGTWWNHAVMETLPADPPAKRAKITMRRPKPMPKSPKAEQTDGINNPGPQDPQMEKTSLVDLPQETPHNMPSAQEQLESLLQQYLDTIYMSKTSLAYFAKGPITRIRNAFISPEEGAPPTHELVTFLRSMLLSHKAHEKKYSQKLQAIIKAIPPGSFSDDETAPASGTAKKPRKKVKLGREGVYPHEDVMIKKWWMSELPNSDRALMETSEQRMRRRIGELKVRETLAQVILVLEVTALEALSTSKAPPEEQTPLDETKDHKDDEPQLPPKKHNKKLERQLDLLLDKLVIWQTLDEPGILDFDTSGGSRANDRLRSFCIEVIIPFYMNRLPEQALLVNEKLGGPAPTSAPKRKANKTSHESRELKEPEAKRSRQSLVRAATDTIGRAVKRVTPSLSRSAADSTLVNGIKREVREVSLSAIPFQRSPSRSARQSMSQIRHLESRQIDLSRPSAAAAAKLKQKQRVAEDLQDAILALKKPNRGLAAGSYAADNERLGLGSSNKPKKPTNPLKKIDKDVQVSATPKAGRRTQDMMGQTPSRPHYNNPFLRHPTSDGQPSSELRIPSSVIRPSSSVVPATVRRSPTARNLAHSSIAETPSNGPKTRASFSPGAARRTIFATPSKPAASSSERRVFGTPHRSMAKLHATNISSGFANIFATPTKAVPVSATKGDTSIYDALGWNDDDDDLV